MLIGAGALAAGLAGGVLLDHEGHKVKEDWEEDKYRMEERVDEDKYRVENRANRIGEDVVDLPDNAARWAGRKVGDAEYDVYEAKEDVEDFPDDAARWAGRKVWLL
jgi:hypothetical protein